MPSAIETLLSILDLEPLEHNLFRGRSPQVGWQRVFGGQVIGQALVAAARTVEGRGAHSLHAYFMRPGDPAVPIIYEVDRIRDGKSFTTRRVVAIQHGEAIFSMSASFQVEEPGLDHQIPMPDVPPPEELPSEADLKALYLEGRARSRSAATGSASGRSSFARSTFATMSAASRSSPPSRSGCGRPARFPTIPTSIAACSPTPPT